MKMIELNKVYHSVTGDNTVVMPVSATHDRVVLHVGQTFGTRVLFFENRMAEVPREEFENTFIIDDLQT